METRKLVDLGKLETKKEDIGRVHKKNYLY